MTVWLKDYVTDFVNSTGRSSTDGLSCVWQGRIPLVFRTRGRTLVVLLSCRLWGSWANRV